MDTFRYIFHDMFSHDMIIFGTETGIIYFFYAWTKILTKLVVFTKTQQQKIIFLLHMSVTYFRYIFL